jgi:hypothetical protein
MTHQSRQIRLEALRRVLRLSQRIMNLFPKVQTAPGTFVMLFFVGAYDTAKDMGLLLSNGRFSLLPAGLRSLVEALANVKLLTVDGENYKFLDARTLKTLLGINKYETQTLASKRSTGKTRSRQKELAVERESLSKRYDKLRAENYRPLTEREKFERADMTNLYFAGYQVLSMQPHHNIQNLFNRYVRLEGECEFVTRLDTKGTVEGFDYWYSMTCMMYSELVRGVCEYFKIDARRQLQQIADSLVPFVGHFPKDYAAAAQLEQATAL